MNSHTTHVAKNDSQLRIAEQLDEVCDRFEAAWCAGEHPRIEDSIEGVEEPLRARLLQELVALEVAYRRKQGDTPSRADYEARFLHSPGVVQEAFGDNKSGRSSSELAETIRLDGSLPSSGQLEIRCPNCQTPMQVEVGTPLKDLTCESCGSHFSLVDKTQTTRMAPPLSELGRFELLERLGVGGFGSVWKARDKELDRTVAIKIPRHGSMSAEEQDRFFQEARAAAQLHHPNIVSIHEVGRDGDSFYIVSDYVSGVTLDDWLTDQQLTSREAAELCAKIADALHHAHEAGVVHRDLKPGNILIDGDTEPHLMDFGLARREVGEATITLDGQVLGTPAYMSPEQARGEAHTADRRSDVYSLGVILFQLLTGERPFRGNVRMLVHQVLNDDPPSPRKLNACVSRDLETITLKCLEKEPDKRYQTAHDVAKELRRFFAGEPIEARPIGRGAKAWRWCRRNPMVAGLSAAIACLLLVATVISITAAGRFMLLAEEREEARATAVTAQRKESDQRHRAEVLADQSRLQLYATSISLAHQKWLDGDISRTLELLEIIKAEEGLSDLRGFEWNYLWCLCHSEKHALREKGETMRSVAFSPDGQLVAVGGDDRVVRFWDSENGEELTVLSGHTGLISALAFSPRGELLATASADRTVKLWDFKKRELLTTLEGHQQEVSCLAFSPDGETLATGTGLLKITGGNPQTRFIRVTDRGEVKLWDVDSHNEIATFDAHRGDILSLAFSPDGSMLVTGSADRTAKIWQVAGLKEQSPIVLDHANPVISVAFSADSQTVATGDWSGFFRFWSPETGNQLSAVHGHVGPIFCIRFSPNFQSLLTAGHDQQVKLWDTATGEQTGSIRGHTDSVWDAAFSPDGKSLATVTRDGAVKLWDLTVRQESDGLYNTGGAHYTVAFSPDGKMLASGGHVAKLWDIASGAELRTLDGDANGDLSVAFSPDGRILAAAGSRGGVEIWDTKTWKLTASLAGHPDKVWSLAFSPDGRLLATGGSGGIMKLWDVATLSERFTITIKDHLVRFVQFSPDGTVLTASCATVAETGLCGLRRWCVQTGQELDPVTDARADWLAYSPDGMTIASGGWDQIIRLWQTPQNHLQRTMKGHMDLLYHGVFSPDSKTLATASWDGTVRLWHVATGQEMMVLRGTTGMPVWNVAFAPDGSSLVMGSGFGRDVGEIAIFRAAKGSPGSSPIDGAERTTAHSDRLEVPQLP